MRWPGWDSLRDRWEGVRSSLWFTPTSFAIGAILLATVLPEIDRTLPIEVGRQRRWLFSGSPSAARTMLSVIAGSLITVISLLFSITILTLQQASTQFTPRVIRAFTRDRGNQVVLGAYIATFVYALLVLRLIRDETDRSPAFVPVIAMTIAIVLALLCLALLVYFIHHSATLFQVSTVIDRIQREIADQIDRLYPDPIGEAQHGAHDHISSHHEQRGHARTIAAPHAGFLRVVDDAALADAIPPGGWAIIHPQIGDFLLSGQPLVDVGPARDIDDQRVEQIQRSCVIGVQRTMTQDTMFGIRQLADIALKSLSPGIHDPTTAEHAISALGETLVRLASREFPPQGRIITPEDDRQPVTIWTNRPSFAEFAAEAFEQIGDVAADTPHVLRHLDRVLTTIANQTTGERRAVLDGHIDRVVAMRHSSV